MKKILSFIIMALFCCISMNAQQTMRVNKTDGTQIIINVDEIDNIDFPQGPALGLSQSVWYLHPTQQLHLNATVMEDGYPADVDAQWSTSDASIASVDKWGTVTAAKDGVATITATYDGATATATVNVTSQKVFDINITSITNTACNFTIAPKQSGLRYYYNMRNTHGDYSVDNMTDYGSLEENVFYFTKDWYQFVADQYGDRSWNEAMQPQLTTGNVSGDNKEFYNTLVPGTEYTLYAIAYDEHGNLAAPIEYTTFETTAPAKSDMTFDITIGRCLSTDAEFTVTPSNNNDPYLVCVQRANYVEWFIERDRTDDMAQPMVESFATDTRYPAIHRGPTTLKCSDFVNVRSQEDYYVIVFGYNDGITTPVSVKHFKTESGWTEPDGDIITVTPPAGLVEQSVTLTADDIYADENDQTVYAPIDPMTGYLGTQGNNVYLYGFFGAMSANWVMGTYDAATKTVTFPYPQYMGKFTFGEEIAKDFYLVGGDLTTGNMCDLVFDYDAANLTLTLRKDLVALANYKPFDFSYEMMLGNYVITLSKAIY